MQYIELKEYIGIKKIIERMIKMKDSNRILLEVIKFIVNSFKSIVSNKNAEVPTDNMEDSEKDSTKKYR